jgi:GT2 family glycosyltransferase
MIRTSARDKEYPLVTVIVVNLNGRKWLEKCIPSILNSNYPLFELIVVDNGSTDDSVEFLKKNYPEVKVIQLGKNMGWSAANNEGIRMAKGDIIVCLSNDIEVDLNCLKEIVKFMESVPSIGIVQCNSISMWDRKTLDSSMNYLDKFGYCYGYAPTTKPQEVFFAEGMAFAVKREIIKNVGLLDDYYFMEYDDMDFCWRARLAGYRIFFLPSAVVYHARGGTVGKTYFQRIKNVEWYTRNHIVTLIKNYEIKNLVKILPIVIIIEIAKILYLFIVKRNNKVAFAALKGLLQVVTDFKIVLKKRKYVQASRKISDEQLMRRMHPFMPQLIYSFIVFQAKGRRFIINAEPPIR